jgi:hypothetical protein
MVFGPRLLSPILISNFFSKNDISFINIEKLLPKWLEMAIREQLYIILGPVDAIMAGDNTSMSV